MTAPARSRRGGRVRLLVANGCPARFVLEPTGLGAILEVLPESPLR